MHHVLHRNVSQLIVVTIALSSKERRKNSLNFNGGAILIIRNREHIFQFSFVMLTNELMRFRGLFYIFLGEVRVIISIGARRRRRGFPRRAHGVFFVRRLSEMCCILFA